MSPPYNQDHACRGCFLAGQREGRVCPAARDAYGLPDVEAQRHAAALHAAILADAGRVPGFAELVRRDAVSHTGALAASISLGLLAPSSDPLFPDSRKEAIRVALPARTQR
jgi:hypothetical protein